MTDTDPLALRHGAFVTTIWSQIEEARAVAQADIGPGRAATQLRRIRHLRSKVLMVHAQEMQRHEFSTPAIDGWFLPLEETLEKAERHFSARVASQKLADALTT
jgi:hypothetical protein